MIKIPFASAGKVFIVCTLSSNPAEVPCFDGGISHDPEPLSQERDKGSMGIDQSETV